MNKGVEIIGKFNNQNKTEVDEIKEKAIELINLIDSYGKDERRKSIAFTEIEKGVMFGVKSLF
jgi:hypothetical protein